MTPNLFKVLYYLVNDDSMTIRSKFCQFLVLGDQRHFN